MDWSDDDKCVVIVAHDWSGAYRCRQAAARFPCQALEDRVVTDRVTKAWNGFRAQQGGICCRNVHQAMRLCYLDAVVNPTIICGLSAVDPTTVTVDTVCQHVKRALGLYKGKHRNGMNGAGSVRLRLVPCPSRSHGTALAQSYWRLLGYLARQPESGACYAAIRAGGLRINGTLRAIGRGSGHARPGPHRRLGTRVSAFCRDRGAWWIDMATGRGLWQELEVSFVDAVARFSLGSSRSGTAPDLPHQTTPGAKSLVLWVGRQAWGVT